MTVINHLCDVVSVINGRVNQMAIRDEAEAKVDIGTYVVSVVCAGTGNIEGVFTIGK